MTVFPRKTYSLKWGRRELKFGERTLIMGILNVTPDSFSDGGRFFDFQTAVSRAQEMIRAGADILDLGGESTRPFSDAVTVEEELRRTIPVIEKIREFSEIPISIDTMKSQVARQALRAGADMVNDISSLQFDPDMAALAAEEDVPVILMHMQGTPKTMQVQPTYHALLAEVITFLEERMRYAMESGIRRDLLLIDPGIGFGKSVNHNLELIRNLSLLHSLEQPIVLGASRKRFIGAVLNRVETEREIGTAAVNAFGVAAGAHVLRVHDVTFHAELARMSDALCTGFDETNTDA